MVPALAVPAAEGADRKPERSLSLLKESRQNARMALKFLAGKQQENGSWKDDPAITGLVVTAMVGSGEDDYGVDSPAVRKALDYVRGFARPDGGIYKQAYANYTTSICAMALIEAGLPQDKPLLKKARAYLLGLQADEEEGIAQDDRQYGGWGYEKHAESEGMHIADMSNTQLAIEALARLQEVAEEDKWDAGVGEGEKTATELAFGKAVKFLERCQNLEDANDQPGAGNDGGFHYRPGESKAEATTGPPRSYGSMTYAGVKSLVYARLAKDDPRVAAAFKWVADHWSVTENPGLGQQSLYYYYMTMARCLNAYGVEKVVDDQGVAHDWRTELLQQILKIQRPDDSWYNEQGRWMERVPELVTAYALLAIEQCWAGW
jgi:squalene-hopene/tetraprenyl-beta-curcumene cyclase